jgi:CDP-4-dehydro-6-deoxyglucose reductase, E3
MAKTHIVTLGADSFTVQSGQVLLDGAIASGVEIPHDCRAGRCGSCMTELKAGITLGGETRQRGTIYACQARVFSDLTIDVEPLPAVDSVRATVSGLVDLTPDVVHTEKDLHIFSGPVLPFHL